MTVHNVTAAWMFFLFIVHKKKEKSSFKNALLIYIERICLISVVIILNSENDQLPWKMMYTFLMNDNVGKAKCEWHHNRMCYQEVL